MRSMHWPPAAPYGILDQMSFVRQWLQRPQNVWLRRALFQIHLWTGVGVGLYVLAISISGSASVFRNEIY
jgi:hypothetical protein